MANRTIEDLHDFVDLVSEKERGGYFGPEEIDTALDNASLEKFLRHLPLYGADEDSQIALAPFKISYPVTNGNSVNGLVVLPADCQKITGAVKVGYDNTRMVPTYFDIDLVNDDELGNRLRSQMIPVTVNKPIGQQTGYQVAVNDNRQAIQLFPKVPNAATIYYLRRPVAPKFNYNGGADNRTITYLPTGSIQLEWNEVNITEILFRAVSFLGINLDNDKLVAYAAMKAKETT